MEQVDIGPLKIKRLHLELYIIRETFDIDITDINEKRIVLKQATIDVSPAITFV